MADAANRTGLAKRLGYLFMRRFGSSANQIVFGILALSLLLCFFVPSGLGRLALVAPLTAGIIRACGLREQGNLAKGLFVALPVFIGLTDVMILSGATSMMTRGVVEEQTGIEILWSQWLLAFLPLSVLTLFACVAILRLFYPAEISELSGTRQYFQAALAEMGPWTVSEKRALRWFVVAMALWATDFVHHISPAVIGFGVGLALSLPKLGVLDGKAVKQVNFLAVVFSAAALGMGAVLLETGILFQLTQRLTAWIEPLLSNRFAYTATLYTAAFLYHFIFANRQSMISTSLPVLLVFAAAHDFNVVAFALLWTIGGGAGLFIYQSGIYVLGYSYGRFDTGDFIKIGAALTLVQAVLLLVLVPYYWPLIGLNWLQ